ncbi:MAG: hypothetical protein J3Q66DRAFT_438750 [Benniella sp.]|nr:MAG: hypothetical protein J3Q66DRAFT_438750 [Benniella sp.]
MSRENPLEIPEITGLVASYLEGEDLARCVQVSKKWRDLLLPYRWRTVRVGSVPSSDSFRKSPRHRIGPYPSDIYRHRHLIHDLTLKGETNGLENYKYPNLRKLRIRTKDDAEDPEREVSLELVEMFPSLVCLILYVAKLASSTWPALLAHPCITSLYMRDGVIKAMDAPLFWELCRRLETLSILAVTFEDGAIPAETTFDHLRELHVDIKDSMVISEELALSLRCPNLEIFGWGNCEPTRNTGPPVLDTNCIPQGHWHRLGKLSIQNYFQDTQVASLLNGVGDGSLYQLRLADCRLEEQGSKALRQHFATLVSLYLGECLSVSSSGIRDILYSCPRLKHLHVKSVHGRDVANGGPWVCQNLRELYIGFMFEESEVDELQPEIFRRLSTLTRLEELEIVLPEDELFGDDHILKFRLENGMGHLASLQQLSLLSFGDAPKHITHVPQMGKKEVAWMLANWKKLRGIYGQLNNNPSINRKLKDVLEFLEIKTEYKSEE